MVKLPTVFKRQGIFFQKESKGKHKNYSKRKLKNSILESTKVGKFTIEEHKQYLILKRSFKKYS